MAWTPKEFSKALGAHQHVIRDSAKPEAHKGIALGHRNIALMQSQIGFSASASELDTEVILIFAFPFLTFVS